MRNKKKNFLYYIKKVFYPFNLVRIIIVNLLFWSLFLFVIATLFVGDNVNMPGKVNTLVLNIQGQIVEELSSNTFSDTLGSLGGYERNETLLWDILEVIDSAQKDDKINSILLDFRKMEGAGLAALSEIRMALDHFKNTDKRVFAYSDYMSQGQYYLASVADEVFIDPMGELFISGFSIFNRYYGEGLERLGVDVNYFHAGKYKSFGEVYTRDSMSEEAKEQIRDWSESLWKIYVSSISESRNFEDGYFESYLDNFVSLLTNGGGSTVQTALNNNLIDQLLSKEKLNSYLVDVSGYSVDSDSFNQINMYDYLQLNRSNSTSLFGDQIALITASGTIYNGFQSPGNIGSENLSSLLNKVLNNDSYKALVLRIDSGGGSAFASEIIRRKVEEIRERGIPVIISMGSVTASGGYWISTASDEIWANETTLTGSIGVFSIIPTIEDPLKKYLGINVDGVGTTWMAGSLRMDKTMDPQVGKIFQSSVDNTYEQFLSLVSESRQMPIDNVNEIAQGRVWSGKSALTNGLVDNNGGLYDAIESAATLAGIEGDDYNVVHLQEVRPFSDQILDSLLNSSMGKALFKGSDLISTFVDNSPLKPLQDLKALNDPSQVYALDTLIFE